MPTFTDHLKVGTVCPDRNRWNSPNKLYGPISWKTAIQKYSVISNAFLTNFDVVGQKGRVWQLAALPMTLHIIPYIISRCHSFTPGPGRCRIPSRMFILQMAEYSSPRKCYIVFVSLWSVYIRFDPRSCSFVLNHGLTIRGCEHGWARSNGMGSRRLGICGWWRLKLMVVSWAKFH